MKQVERYRSCSYQSDHFSSYLVHLKCQLQLIGCSKARFLNLFYNQNGVVTQRDKAHLKGINVDVALQKDVNGVGGAHDCCQDCDTLLCTH